MAVVNGHLQCGRCPALFYVPWFAAFVQWLQQQLAAEQQLERHLCLCAPDASHSDLDFDNVPQILLLRFTSLLASVGTPKVSNTFIGELIGMLLVMGSDGSLATGYNLLRTATQHLLGILPQCVSSILLNRDETEKGKVVDRALIEQIVRNFSEDRVSPNLIGSFGVVQICPKFCTTSVLTNKNRGTFT